MKHKPEEKAVKQLEVTAINNYDYLEGPGTLLPFCVERILDDCIWEDSITFNLSENLFFNM